MKTVIVTDSTAYLTEKQREQYHIQMIPLNVIFGMEVYEEEINLSTEDFYEMVKESELPTTSQPSVGQFVQLFEQLSEEYDEIISIHLSSGISGTYQGAFTAASMVEEKVKVYPFDSEISCMMQGFYVLEAAKMAQEGKNAKEILPRLEEMKKSVQAYFIVDDLSHLQRGGRLNAASALIGGLLQLKPILCVENKKIVPFEKVRTKKKALKRVEELLEESVQPNAKYLATVIHANREEEAKEWVDELSKKYPDVEFSISYFGPVIGTHLGEGSIGLGWYKL